MDRHDYGTLATPVRYFLVVLAFLAVAAGCSQHRTRQRDERDHADVSQADDHTAEKPVGKRTNHRDHAGSGALPSRIESRIDGTFEGFEAGRIFKLVNGQVWEQTEAKIRIRIRVSPRVVIWRQGGLYR